MMVSRGVLLGKFHSMLEQLHICLVREGKKVTKREIKDLLYYEAGLLQGITDETTVEQLDDLIEVTHIMGAQYDIQFKESKQEKQIDLNYNRCN
jgi:hypothetical protein